MNESDAEAALRAQGIKNPSRQLVHDYVCANSTQGEQDAQERAEGGGEARPHPSSQSNLKPILKERGELVRPAGKRRAGRPPVVAPWFEHLARVMSDGTPLRKALSVLGVQGLTERQIRALYRNTALRAMRETERQKWQREWGLRSHRSRTARPKGCRGADCLGLSREMLRRL